MQDCKCADFPDDSGKQSYCLLSIVSEEHEVITKLREICLDSLPRLSINEDECSTYELTVETDKGVLVMSLFKSLRFTKLGLEDKDVDILGTLRDQLVYFLIEYSKLIGSKVDFGIFFRKSTSSSVLQRQEQNRIIYKEERMYLGPIRKFVKENFEKLWNKILDEEQQEKLYKEKSYEWQQIACSKYDNDPNLME